MKKISGVYMIVCCVFLSTISYAQTGIGTTSPSSNSVLDVSSNNKGVLIPRIDFNNRPTGSVDNGMLIYVTANGPAGNNRFYYFNGTQWEGEKNTDDNQTLSLVQDTLKISQGNYVLLSNLYSQLGYTHCGTSYVQLTIDAQNCGACGNACTFPNALTYCANSSCYMGTCTGGFGNCDNNTANGCETNLQTNLSNCGSCGNICPGGPNAISTCNSGACGFNCNTGFLNCDANNANGCEVNSNSDVNNCGSCAHVCPSASNASATCTAAACGVVCNSGFLNCDANNANGCEVNSNSDVNNCGSCAHVCPSASNASATCAAAACGIVCNAGFLNCDANNANGCEINSFTDVNNCGTCGHACSVANGTAACTAAACTIAACNAGFLNCDANNANGCEINSFTDVNNCGTCGHVCSVANGTAACAAAACTVAACNAGFANCDLNAANGCEINTTNNVANCGSCGHICTVANGTAGCTSSICTVAACNAGFANCDLNAANGCEINTNTDANNCGSCGHVCPGIHSCVGAVCQ